MSLSDAVNGHKQTISQYEEQVNYCVLHSVTTSVDFGGLAYFFCNLEVFQLYCCRLYLWVWK